ncbi:MAG: hypothetical protein U9N81_04230 [Bacillota bacterium]|nr:hypothetical protein [Bacillota bacterium]
MMQLRMPQSIHQEMRSDLRRSHPFAFEHVGYVFTKPAGHSVLVVTGYQSIPDQYYINDNSVGARIDHRAIALAMKRADMNKEGILHTHIHNKSGLPIFSRDDRADHPNFLRSFRNAAPGKTHGFLLLSTDKMMARVWLPQHESPIDIFRYTIVNLPLSLNASGGFLV